MVYGFIKVAADSKVSIFMSYASSLVNSKIRIKKRLGGGRGEADEASEKVTEENTLLMKEWHLQRCK